MIMNITIDLNGKLIPFSIWRSSGGTVFTKSFSFDSETTLIDKERPWLTPAYVVGAACDGTKGYFISREHLLAFIDAHHRLPWVMHNAPFDLKVIHLGAPSRDIYGLVDKNRVWDTQLLHRLYVLGTEGHPATWQSSLQHCAKEYLGLEVEKETKDKAGDDIRLSFGKYLRKPIEEIDPQALQYLAMDAAATIGVYRQLRKMLHDLLVTSQEAFGFVDDQWLADAQQRWGPQTHHIQLRAAIVLETITANGLPIDVAAGEKLRENL